MLNLDCDHYINNSKAIREAMCFLMDPQLRKKTCYVQFPQRFDGIDRHDRYANRNTVFFDVRRSSKLQFIKYAWNAFQEETSATAEPLSDLHKHVILGRIWTCIMRGHLASLSRGVECAVPRMGRRVVSAGHRPQALCLFSSSVQVSWYSEMLVPDSLLAKNNDDIRALCHISTVSQTFFIH